MTAYEFHPLANIFALIEGTAFDDFCTGLRLDGRLHDKIVLFEGKILDGRNRQRACDATGVTAHYRTFNPDVEGDPRAFVWSKNANRRHLSLRQRAMAMADLGKLGWGGYRLKSSIDDLTIDQRAELAGVGSATIERADTVKEQGAPELQDLVRQDKLAISTAADISKLSHDEQRDLINRADPDVVREVARTLRGGDVDGARAIMASRQEPDESLDYSPTPPWATRALFERVFPHLGVHRVDQVWEPACGEGHMTGVIEEYARGTVIGTDVFDYSREHMPPAWWRKLNFLDEKEETPVVDWIITNPPFKDGEAFALRALALTKRASTSVGVAFFVRWQWIETVARYERLFNPYPPTLVCPFAERVPLHMGRWEPDGSTATAYCWVIWMPWRVPRVPTELFWIPPGCREGLSRPDDRDRFTARPVKPFVQAPDSSRAAEAGQGEPATIVMGAGLLASVARDEPANHIVDVNEKVEVEAPGRIEVTVGAGNAYAEILQFGDVSEDRLEECIAGLLMRTPPVPADKITRIDAVTGEIIAPVGREDDAAHTTLNGGDDEPEAETQSERTAARDASGTEFMPGGLADPAIAELEDSVTAEEEAEFFPDDSAEAQADAQTSNTGGGHEVINQSSDQPGNAGAAETPARAVSENRAAPAQSGYPIEMDEDGEPVLPAFLRRTPEQPS